MIFGDTRSALFQEGRHINLIEEAQQADDLSEYIFSLIGSQTIIRRKGDV